MSKAETILMNDYGVGAAAAPACAILWAVDNAASTEDGKMQELVAINKIRRKHGKPAVYFDTTYA